MSTRFENCRKNLLGKEFETNKCGKCTVIKYDGYNDVTVKFHQPSCIVKCQTNNLREGKVSNPMYPSFNGVGFFGIGKYTTKDRAYRIWTSLIQRTSKKGKNSVNSAYKYVTVCNEWLNFQTFAEWMHSQPFFDSKDDRGKSYELDKDILVKGNKIYSPETCCFVPSCLNKLLVKNNSSRGKYPIGVCYHKIADKYVSVITLESKTKHLGCFSTPEEAFKVYKKEKENYVKRLTECWKGRISEEAYEVLSKYEVNIHD